MDNNTSSGYTDINSAHAKSEKRSVHRIKAKVLPLSASARPGSSLSTVLPDPLPTSISPTRSNSPGRTASEVDAYAQKTRPGSGIPSSPRFYRIPLVICILIIILLVAFSTIDTFGHADASQSQSASHQTLSVLMDVTMLPTQTAVATTAATPVATDAATGVAATREAYASQVADNLQALRTSVALTHEPTDIPGPPSPEASPTPMLGILPGCSNTNAYEPQAISCWRGVVDGQMVDVDAGREGRNGNTNQGILRVHIQGQQNFDIYDTPSQVGAVTIVSVDGTLFTLSTIGPATPQTFEFDLATRQWVTP